MNTQEKNLFRCWECRKKGIDCYCNLDSKTKENLKNVNKIIEDLK